MEWIIYCDCGTSFTLMEEARILNKEMYDFLTILFYSHKGSKQDQKIRKHTIKPKKLWKRRKKTIFSNLNRLENPLSYRNSQTHIEWTEDFCKHLDALASEDHSYVAAWYERARFEKVWAISSNSQQHNTALIQSRADYPKSRAKLREMKKRMQLKLDTHLIPSNDVISRFDSAKDNSFSNIMNLRHVTVHPISTHQARETCCVPCWSRFKIG